MTSLITGGLGLASGLFGMIGGLRGAKAQAEQPTGPGIAPLMYLISGKEEQTAARAEAENLGRQGVMAYEQAQLEAAQKERQVRAFREEQALKFASSGITLQGSPLGVLEETRALGQQEVDAIRRRGEQVAKLYEEEGLQMLRRGSAAAFGGFANAMQSNWQSQMQAATQKNQARAQRDQAIQTGIAGLSAGVQGIGAGYSKFKNSGSGSGTKPFSI